MVYPDKSTVVLCRISQIEKVDIQVTLTHRDKINRALPNGHYMSPSLAIL